MKQYAVIHAVAGLFEGYSDTTCEFFPKRGFAEKHLKQILDDYRKDEMCVLIEHQDDGAEVTMTRNYEDYHACVPFDMEHDDWVAENGDDCSVEVFRIIEIDCERYENAPSTESCGSRGTNRILAKHGITSHCVCPWWLVYHLT